MTVQSSEPLAAAEVTVVTVTGGIDEVVVLVAGAVVVVDGTV